MSARTISRLAALALLCSIAGGCTFFKAPKLTVHGVQLMNESDDGLVLEFDVDADNFNEEALPLEQIEYSLWLDNQRVFTGVRSPEATLRRLGTQQLRLPAVVNLNEHPRPTGVVPYRLSGTLKYRTPGEIPEILYDSRVWRPSVDFSDSGEIDFDTADLEPVTTADAQR